MDEKITYDDVLEHEHLFALAPPFLLERMAKRNSNIVSKFRSKIRSEFDKLDDVQRSKLNVILNSDIGDLQAIMKEAYLKTNKKQYKILANPDYGQFIELNLEELRKMV
jgi:hypothetical protein